MSQLSNNNDGNELSRYRNQIENIADQLCVAVKGQFDFSIQVNNIDESIQKLSMLINFVIDAARRSLTAIEEKNAKLTELDKLKSDFMANISHELRTPLTLIIGPLETILNDKSLSATQRSSLERIQRNAHRLYILVNDLLDYSKLEAGKFVVHEDLVDLNEIIQQQVEDAQGLGSERNLKLTFKGDKKLGLMLLDKKMLEKIVMNLISNAIKFTPQGGKIDVQVAKQVDTAVIKVRDTGIGIPASQLDKLFQRFHQIDSSASRAFEGTGIGLAITHQFTHLMHGKIDVESEINKGTTFTVYLPIRMMEKGAEPPVVKKTLGKHIKTSLAMLARHDTDIKVQNRNELIVEGTLPLLLVVDDNDDMRSYIISLLQNAYEIISAKNGKEALSLLEKFTPQAILSDVMMPGMDGYQLTKIIKGSSKTKNIPVILITAKAGKEAIVGGLEAGADDYLSKPFSPEELKARTQAAIRISQTLSALNKAYETIQSESQALNQAHEELKKVQFQLIQQSKMAAIGQLAAGVAHEINNPIAYVGSNIEMMQTYFLTLKEIVNFINNIFNEHTTHENWLAAKNKWLSLCSDVNITHVLSDFPKLISEAGDGLDRVSEIVASLKSYSYSDQSDLAETDLNECSEMALKIVHNELKYKCKIHKKYSQLPKLVCNSRLLVQVLMNILINACHAIKQQGDIFIQTEVVDNEAVISIRDNGMGISSQHLEKLFDPFFTTKPVGQGTGLGLSISYNIIHNLGGRIEVESLENEGSTFSIFLPIQHVKNSLRQSPS